MDNTEDNIQEIINKSGNSFHTKVILSLREKEWNVLISPYYSDNATGKAREIDIVAEKLYEMKSLGVATAYIKIQLLIECKYTKDEKKKDTVFWFDSMSSNKVKKHIQKISPLKEDYLNGNEHHYLLLEEAAKLFESTKENYENEDYYKAIDQVLKAYVYFNTINLNLDDQNKTGPPVHTIKYPVIISNNFNRLHGISISGGKHYRLMDNFVLDLQYAYTDREGKYKNDYFIIDFVSFEKLQKYISDIEKNEIEKLKYILSLPI